MSSMNHRRSIRLHGYDHSAPGSYAITICVQHRECLFGDVVQGDIRLNQAGTVIEWWWQDIPKRRVGRVCRDA